MSVFIVIYTYDYEGSSVVAVYAEKSAAESRMMMEVENRNKTSGYNTCTYCTDDGNLVDVRASQWYSVEEWDIQGSHV